MTRIHRSASHRGARGLAGLALLLFFAPLVGLADEPQPKTAAATPVAKAAGESFRVPYQLTDTKHILVRARINGKGPFHLIMDTGAPALFVSTESAKKHGLPAAGKDGWGEFDKFEIEGGPVLEKVKARVETPFQVSGMNAMGLPGIRLDGMLGYTILAQYRIELDLTKQHMVWTKLNWKPPTPQGISENGQPAPEISAMSNMAQLVQMFMKKKPEPVFVQRGLLGIELEDGKEAVVIGKVLPESPAAKAGLKPGDRIVQFQDKPVKNVAELHALAAEHAAKDQLSVEVERAGQKQTLNVATGRGL